MVIVYGELCKQEEVLWTWYAAVWGANEEQWVLMLYGYSVIFPSLDNDASKGALHILKSGD